MASRPDIVREEVVLPTQFVGRLAFILHNVLTPEECQEYIDYTEKRGYEPALVNVDGQSQRIADIRNNGRCLWFTEEEAGKIWERIKQEVPTEFRGSRALGLNDRLSFLRYDKGEYFKAHYDGNYQGKNGEVSYITVQMYLNEGFEGGETTFLSFDGDEAVSVVPKTGSALIFQHDILHEGSELKEGRKYAVRTDVMFTPRNEEMWRRILSS